MNKLISIIALVIISSIAPKASAAGTVTCTPAYGGGQTCVQEGQLLINKKVAKPNTDEFVENLEQNDPRFVPEQTIKFQIILTNTGNAVVEKVKVTDAFPNSITSFSGRGTYDQATNTLTFEETNIQPNETRIITLTGKTVSADKLVDLQCQINQAVATVGDKTSQDSAKFCVQRQILGAETPVTKGGKQVFPAPQVTTTPPTGPEMLSLLALIPTGIFGQILRKKTLLK